MAVVGVKVREMGTEDLRTTRSDEAIDKKTDATRLIMLPLDTAFAEAGHKLFRNSTPTEPAVRGPIVKPLMVIVTTAVALIEAPEVVITTAVADVAPHVAVKPATLLAPEATVGTTEDAKKSAGYKRVKAVPEDMRDEGVNTRVRGTDDLPVYRSETDMPNMDRDMPKQCK